MIFFIIRCQHWSMRFGVLLTTSYRAYSHPNLARGQSQCGPSLICFVAFVSFVICLRRDTTHTAANLRLPQLSRNLGWEFIFCNPTEAQHINHYCARNTNQRTEYYLHILHPKAYSKYLDRGLMHCPSPCSQCILLDNSLVSLGLYSCKVCCNFIGLASSRWKSKINFSFLLI